MGSGRLIAGPSQRSQTSCGSSVAEAAASTNIRPSSDHTAGPGTIVAILASFTMLTRTPSMNTSTMPQGCRTFR